MAGFAGPWKLYETTDGSWFIDDAGGKQVMWIGVLMSKRHEANAALISAAPDLYDACKKLLYGNETTWENAITDMKAALDKADNNEVTR